MKKSKRKNNISIWIKKILLLGQQSYYKSFSKLFLFLVTHLALLLMVNLVIKFVANKLGYLSGSLSLRVVIPTVVSWYLFFIAGNTLTQKSISILVLLYGYMMLVLFAFSNFKAILNISLGSNENK